jgi:hypothetical protein
MQTSAFTAWSFAGRESTAASRSSCQRSRWVGSRPIVCSNRSNFTDSRATTALVRVENSSTTRRSIPSISAIPFTTGPHSTPSRRVSSARSAAWNNADNVR